MKSGGLGTLVATLFLFVVNLPAIMNEAGALNLPFYGELIMFFYLLVSHLVFTGICPVFA